MEFLKHQAENKFGLFRIAIVNFFSWFFMLFFIFVFVAYRQIIDVILKIRFGETYGGLLDKSDVLFWVPEKSKCCITTVLYIKSDREVNLLQSLRKVFEEKVFRQPESYPKLTSSKHDFGGYPYWIKNDCTLDEVVKPLKLPSNENVTEKYLKEITAKISNADHPRNGAILWDIHISEKPLKDNCNGNNCYRYPVITRYHHCIADGTSLVALFLRLFGDETSKNYNEELFKKLFKEVPCRNSRTSLNQIIKYHVAKVVKTTLLYLDLIFLSLGRVIDANQLKPSDVNSLHGTNYSGEKIVAWAAEETVECIPLIKKIKKRANSTFTCVISTAISASMTNYFKRNSLPIPDFTSGGIAKLLDFPTMDASKPVSLENKTTACIIELPSTHKSRTLVEALGKVTEKLTKRTLYSDALINHIFLEHVLGYIPVTLMLPTMGFTSQTFLITNVPGGSQVKILDGCVLEKIVPVAPNFRGVGISFALLSYDDRLQIGVLVDKSLTKSQEEVQKIADDVLYYIKMLDIEVKRSYGEE